MCAPTSVVVKKVSTSNSRCSHKRCFGAARRIRSGGSKREESESVAGSAEARSIRSSGNTEGPARGGHLLQGLELFAGLEANRLAGRNRNLGSGTGIPADSRLPRLDGKDAKAPQLDPVSL